MREADDTLLHAGSRKELQTLIDHLVSSSHSYGKKLNCKKSQIVVVSNNNISNSLFHVTYIVLHETSHIKYPRCNLNKGWDYSLEIGSRIEKARSAVKRMKSVPCNIILNIGIRIRVLRCYIFSILLSSCMKWRLGHQLRPPANPWSHSKWSVTGAC